MVSPVLMKIRAHIVSVLVLFLALSGRTPAVAQGTIVWNGSLMTFTNLPGSDWTQPINQDHITANVWLTRATTHGFFNAASEGGYSHNASPADTEWAYGQLANYSSLPYSDWESWNGMVPPSMVGQDAVLHLISDDIYIGLKFDFWGGPGGGFTYERTTPFAVPEPATGALALAGGLLLLGNSVRKNLPGGK
jgi:hypothetical protein